MLFEEMSFSVRGCIFEVYRRLGPGLLERVYQKALQLELQNAGLHVRTQVGLPVLYKGQELDMGFRIDVLVDDRIVLEIKSVEALHEVHKKQLLTYLKLSKRELGFLINFNVARLEDGKSIIRIVNSRNPDDLPCDPRLPRAP
jgi:GxxExxY protein